MTKVLSEKEIAHALFFAIKHNDLEHVHYLLKLGAPVQTAFYLKQDQIVYTSNFLVGKVAEIIKQYGHSHAKSKFALQILDMFIEGKADLRCHCSPKNSHYCALSEAFKHIKFDTEDDLFIDKNLLILKLLYHGATYRNHKNSKEYLWTGLETLLAYIDTRKDEVIDLLTKNRHTRCAMGKTYCAG